MKTIGDYWGQFSLMEKNYYIKKCNDACYRQASRTIMQAKPGITMATLPFVTLTDMHNVLLYTEGSVYGSPERLKLMCFMGEKTNEDDR